MSERSWFNDVGSRPTPDEALELFDRWTSSFRRRREELAAAAAGRGLTIDARSATLAALTEMVADGLGADQPCDDPPVWFGSEERSWGMRCGGATLLDGLIVHVGDVIRARVGATWELRDDSRPLDAYRWQPVMSVGMAPPWRFVTSAVIGVRDGRADGTRLVTMLESNLTRASIVSPEPAFGVSLTPTDRSDVMVGTFSEELQYLLGEGYESMVAELRATPGVRAWAWEDRESFLLEVAPDPAADLEERMQAVIDRWLAST